MLCDVSRLFYCLLIMLSNIIMWVVIFVQVAFGAQCIGDTRFRKFFRIKKCQRSDQPVVGRSNQGSVQDCMNFSRDKNGLAFNYSPLEAARFRKKNEDDVFFNCLALGCPEGANATSLIEDKAYDYYSAYGNLTDLVNATCVKSLGMFRIFDEKENYTTAIKKCQKIGADLANILSEIRTNSLSNIVISLVSDWYKVAYVGLDDRAVEGHFETPLGDSITCYKYRAWSPGHPRNKIKSDDCVIIDSERSWSVVDCRKKLPFMCEYYYSAPIKSLPVECDDLENEEKKKECKEMERRRERGKPDRCDEWQ